jgi:hypothetical protein
LPVKALTVATHPLLAGRGPPLQGRTLSRKSLVRQQCGPRTGGKGRRGGSKLLVVHLLQGGHFGRQRRLPERVERLGVRADRRELRFYLGQLLAGRSYTRGEANRTDQEQNADDP